MNPVSELQKHACALYLCKDTNNPPKQHIFWVDDVWFHGDSSDQSKPKKCHFAGEGNSIDATICEEKKLHWHEPKYTVSTDLTPVWNPLQPFPVLKDVAVASASATNDSEEAKSDRTGSPPPGLTEDELIPILAQFAFDNNYGLVLCSFEFFFLHREEIAKHCEYAAIFDVRHQAAVGKTDLITAWNTGLAAPKINDLFNRCGYRLYLELAKCCQSHPNGFSIERHACFLTSKNGFHDDYLKELIAMLSANALSKAVHLLRPLVLSKSNLGGSEALLHSLELFNTSFRHALSYEYKEKNLLGDFIERWNGGTAPNLGHDVSSLSNQAEAKTKLNCGSLIEFSDVSKVVSVEEADIRALFEPLHAANLRVSTFWSILTHLVSPDGLTNNVAEPTTTTFASAIAPSGFLIIGLARFLVKLRASDGHEQRQSVTATLWTDKKKLNFTVTLSGHDTDCATKFLRAISGISADGSNARDRSSGARAAWLDLTSGMTSLLGSVEQHANFSQKWAEKIIQNKKGWPESKLSWKLSADGKSEIEMCIGTTN